MKILIVIGPALGTINHALALSELLQESGHEVIWLTGPDARSHLRKMKSSYETYYSKAHNLKFKANNPGGLPHFVYTTCYDYLKKSTEHELNIIQKIKPQLIITRHHYSPTITSRIFKVPFAYYYSDGAEYILNNPYNRWSNPTGVEDYLRVCRDFGITLDTKEYTTDYLFSPYLNIIRGVPIISSLEVEQIEILRKANCFFAGMLTYDGPRGGRNVRNWQKIAKNKPIIYVTFGTHFYEKERIQIVLKALVNFSGHIFISTGYFNPQDFCVSLKNVTFFKYIPNDQIIAHANLVIHHAGSGTSLTCFSLGVPQIVIPNNPNYSGQTYLADTIENNKCGKHVPFQTLTVRKLKKEIDKILLNSIYKKNASNLKEKISRQNLECKQNILNAILKQSYYARGQG